MNKSTLFRYSWNMLCTSVCLYQLYHVFDVYFAYPTAVNIDHPPPATYAEIPGITIEFQPRERLWRRSKLQQKYPHLFDLYEKAVLGKNATPNTREKSPMYFE